MATPTAGHYDSDLIRLKDLEYERDRNQKDLNDLTSKTNVTTRLIVTGVLALLLTLVACTIIFVGSIIVLRQGRRYSRFRNNPREVGLRSVCQEFLKLIRYQTTLSSGEELGASYKFFSGKLTSSKQLSDRPLSLPGLTATCSDLLSKIAEVFRGKVIICIDELDKITDVAQLTELLKGIKGILGQEHTYFLLTISEDAMSHFSERLSSERNLIESSFEEVVYLDRVDGKTAAAIIRNSLAEGAPTDESQLNSLLLWIFGAGVPREIKRLVFSCHSSGIDLYRTSPVAVWKLIYLGMLKGMLTTTSPAIRKNDGESQYKFLRCIEGLVTLVETIPAQTQFFPYARAVVIAVDQCMNELTELDKSTTSQKDVNGTDAAKTETSNLSVYQALLVELLIGAVAMGIATGEIIAESQSMTDHLDPLIYAYKYVPINPQYARFALEQFTKQYLAGFDIWTAPRAAA